MKVYFEVAKDPRIVEGRTSLSRKLKEFLQKRGFEFTSDVAEADIMHVNSGGVSRSYWAYKMKIKYDIPCVYSLYSIPETEPLSHIRNYLIQLFVLKRGSMNWLWSYSAVLPLMLRSLYLKRLDRVVVSLEYVKRKLFNNTQVIRIGIDLNKFKPKRIAKSHNKVKVAFFCHPSVLKGLTDFVEASRNFSKNIEPYIFLTILDKKVLQYISKKNPNINVHG